jgi:hypothetical protein
MKAAIRANEFPFLSFPFPPLPFPCHRSIGQLISEDLKRVELQSRVQGGDDRGMPAPAMTRKEGRLAGRQAGHVIPMVYFRKVCLGQVLGCRWRLLQKPPPPPTSSLQLCSTLVNLGREFQPKTRLVEAL